MHPLIALAVGLLLGGGTAALLLSHPWASPADRRADPAAGPVGDTSLVRRLVDHMDPAVVLLASDDQVLIANPSARALGIVRDDRLLVHDLLDVARAVRAGGSHRADVALPGDLVGGGPRMVGVHGMRLDTTAGRSDGPVGLVLQDVTEARRVEAVRRDFVANVGHELKTPVGALALLAEATEDAADDPETVRRFAARMSHEADRLSRLVRELIDLSRLQGAEPMPDLAPVRVDDVVAEAVDRTRLAAAAKGITLAVGSGPDLVVRGVEAQLATAVTNLLANAVAYSPAGRKIAVGARARAGFAEIAVTDSGIGIPRSDRGRVFERFYRVDQSRASATGGTGLGLAIVKHVATNHGGSVTVWSEEGLGSTFTLRIPLAPAEPPPAPGGPGAPTPRGPRHLDALRAAVGSEQRGRRATDQPADEHPGVSVPQRDEAVTGPRWADTDRAAAAEDHQAEERRRDAGVPATTGTGDDGQQDGVAGAHPVSESRARTKGRS
ncbi:two-component sensor histidine kinase [Modestobacter sp. I12A-02628]|uniref:Sensor-like histidine kinase SenX3 n=1 Tax=Goekera deserti TaxID=2497753 RepID=A0A7K3W944_9ACTN|nr:ATP-binding protein [Goekera deserti]MPR00476.1 two-component sensor histidine kinase [Goekera deserti]NDI49126.1 two-component sensor histidine kinase [Goekera deserti]NEL52864.1 two-component sensor histidine kinase [Goekera deserti]